MNIKPSVTIAVATYNTKEYLRIVLESITYQTIKPIEVLIADDGSYDGTREMIEKMSKTYFCPLLFFTQEDNGFRKVSIMNKTLAKSTGEYIVHIDGDVILNKHFVEDHLYVAKEGYASTGSRAQTSEKLKDKLLQKGYFKLSPFTCGVSEKLNAFRSKFLMRRFLYTYKQRKPYFARGCNMSFWKKDFLAVNGFNEDIKYIGTEDYEFFARLLNKGIKKQFIKFNAIQYHIYHKKRAIETHPDNLRILNEVIDDKLDWCKNGVDKYLK